MSSEATGSPAPSQGETTDAGLDAAESCKRIDHPATTKAIDDVCAVVEGARLPESLGGGTVSGLPAEVARGVRGTESGPDPSSEAERAHLERITSPVIQQKLGELSELMFGAVDDAVARDGTLKLTEDQANQICAAIFGLTDSRPGPVPDSPEVVVDPDADAAMLSIIERAGSDDEEDDDAWMGDSDSAMQWISHAELDRRRRLRKLRWVASIIVAFLVGGAVDALRVYLVG